ncbi:hypothetical protein [Elizabethkingia phage TCUEAP1]|nr:hypothetical protein [Elizabethkingia phage TCUEAP1]
MNNSIYVIPSLDLIAKEEIINDLRFDAFENAQKDRHAVLSVIYEAYSAPTITLANQVYTVFDFDGYDMQEVKDVIDTIGVYYQTI